MRLLLLKPLFLKIQSNLLKIMFEKSSQENIFSDLILLLSKINKGMFLSAEKCSFLLSLLLVIKENTTEKNRKITSTKKIIYSF